MDNDSNEISPTFCILPWIHMATRTWGGVTPCCVSPHFKDENLNEKSFSEVWNGSSLRQLRKTMMRGEKSPFCKRCYKEEESNIASHRQRSNDRWGKSLSFKKLVEDTDDRGFYKGPFIYLDLRLGNRCNLECNMCSPAESSRWEKLASKIFHHAETEELKKFTEPVTNLKRGQSLNDWFTKDHIKKDILENLSSLRQVTLAGGEPFLIKEHRDFLDECIRQDEAHHIAIHYHTNGTLLDSKLFKKWEKFESVMVFMSLDDLGERNHYIRYPSSWESMVKALHFIDRESPSNVQSIILCTIQALNIFYFPEFAFWVSRQKFKKVSAIFDSIVHTELVHNPYFLNCQVLPKNVKEIVTEKFECLYREFGSKAERFRHMVNFMNKEDKSESLPVLKDHLQALDKSRGTSFSEAFSELSSLLWPKKPQKTSSTFCVLPWMHLSCDPSGKGRICCEGFEKLKNDDGQHALWKNARGIESYMNSKDYKKIRLQMINNERPSQCQHCFKQEDHGVESPRQMMNEQYQPSIDWLLEKTQSDGTLKNPEILYIDVPMGNLCNLKCRMCSPWCSFPIAKDWKRMEKSFDFDSALEIFKDEWYESPQTLRLIRESLPSVRHIFLTGGEPMIVKGHHQLLKMIREEGEAWHIELRYNSNQTVIPKDISNLWKDFKKVYFNCSVEAHGQANDYIRYPSKWERQFKNILYLDDLASKQNNLDIHIHTTLQAYNIARIPQLLDTLRYTEFKKIHRFPYFIWVKEPPWLSPSVLPREFKQKVVSTIEKRIDSYQHFFLNYNPDHTQWNQERMKMLKEFCFMILNENRVESDFDLFIKETKQYDRLRNQSVIEFLPELTPFFETSSMEESSILRASIDQSGRDIELAGGR